MKAAVGIIAFVATILAPAHAVDWTAVEEKVFLIGLGASEVFEKVEHIAKNESPEIEDAIHEKLLASDGPARAVRAKFLRAIKARTYPESEARDDFSQFQNILDKTKDDILMEAEKLSEDAQKEIKDVIETYYEHLLGWQNQLFEMLREQ